MIVVTAQQMRELDRFTIQEMGIPGCVLMENAGRGVVEVLTSCFADWRIRNVAILCGKGNNGGDGFVAARYLRNLGGSVRVFLAGRKEDLAGDARWAMEVFLRDGGDVTQVGVEGGLSCHDIPLDPAAIVIDALLGTGLRSEVKDPLASIIGRVNQHRGRVLAVDIPSGLCSDTGRPLGVATKASVTVTFGFPKLGHFLYPGRALCGELYLVDIGIPQRAAQLHGAKRRLVTPEMLAGLLPPRAPEAHKGNFGHVLVLAGSPGKTGAGVMASEAALRVGAGLVTLGLPKSLNLAMEARLTEVMTLPLADGDDHNISLRALDEILGELKGKSCVALGPGLSTKGDTPELVRELAFRVELPMVIDADGLNALVGMVHGLGQAPAPRILTPHPGEMSRLLSMGTLEVQRDRIGAALRLAELSGSHVLLKGAGTVLADPEGRILLVPTGNPAMASAGMGDVLTGILAGLLAQGLNSMDAMALGAFLHGWMADEWVSFHGGRGLLATDLIHMIPDCLERILQGRVKRMWPRDPSPRLGLHHG